MIFAAETDRLRLRELTPDDLPSVAEMLTDPDVMHFWPRPYTLEECEAWILRNLQRYEEIGFGYWLVERKKDGRPIGQAGLLPQVIDGKDEIGLGYILHKPFWGQGYAVEAARACLDYAFRGLALDHVLILIRPENEPSLRVAQRLEAVQIGETIYAEFLHLIYRSSTPVCSRK